MNQSGEKVTIRFRAAKNNVDVVFFISGAIRQAMEYEKTVGRFEYYKIEIEAGTETIRYYFEIRAGKLRCFYNKKGISQNLQTIMPLRLSRDFQLRTGQREL